MNRTRFLYAALAASLVMSAGSTALAQKGNLSFFESSEVVSGRITVDDVARLEGIGDSMLKEKIRSIDLGVAPEPMQTRALSRPLIEAALRQAGVLEELRVRFPKRLKVHRPGQKLSAADATELASAAIDRFIEENTPKGHSVTADPVKLRSHLLLPQGEVTVRASTRQEPDFRKSNLIKLTFMVDGETNNTRQLSVRFRLTGPACVLSRDVDRGDIIQQEDVEERVQVLKAHQLPCKEVVGMSARSLLRAGSSPLTTSLRAPLLIRRGDLLTIVYAAGPLKVTTRGEATRDGARGEWIPVININSRKTIKARVTAPGWVQVQ